MVRLHISLVVFILWIYRSMYMVILLKHDIACIFFDIDNANMDYLVEGSIQQDNKLVN